MNALLVNQANQKAAIGVEEFREILDDVTDHFCLLNANDLESCAYYLFDSLKKAELLNGIDEDEYLRTICDYLYENFPGYYSLLLLDHVAA
jgi:hypothetical protein